MHSFSLVVQAITLYAGIMLLTQRSVLATFKLYILFSVASHPASFYGHRPYLATFGLQIRYVVSIRTRLVPCCAAQVSLPREPRGLLSG